MNPVHFDEIGHRLQDLLFPDYVADRGTTRGLQKNLKFLFVSLNYLDWINN